MRRQIKLVLLALITLTTVLPPMACQPEETLTPARDYAGSIQSGGLERTYIAHIPPISNRTKKLPLVFALHGGYGTADSMKKLTYSGFDTLADRDGFIVVYPDGIGRSWNDGRVGGGFEAQLENIDDVGFFSDMIDYFIKEYNADPKRVYVTGISMGAVMSYRLAGELSAKITAAAPVCGGNPSSLTMAPSQPVSILAIDSTADPIAPWDGGSFTEGKKSSVPDTVQFWVTQDGCATTPLLTQLPDKDPTDGTRVHLETYRQGNAGTEVVLCVVENGGHTWPGGWQYLPEITVGKTSRDIDACEMIWDFFKKHTK